MYVNSNLGTDGVAVSVAGKNVGVKTVAGDGFGVGAADTISG